MKSSDFKSLIVWQKSISLCKETYLMVKKLPREEMFALSSQMRRAAVSIPSNIAEGQSRNSSKEFLNFLSIARGSVSELETQCIIAVEVGLLSQTDVEIVRMLCQEISKMTNGLSSALQLKPNN